MPSVSFIYRIKNNPKIYYGKCVFNSLSDDHEGLDKEVLYCFLNGINQYRKNKNLHEFVGKNIHIGVLACSAHDSPWDYSTKRERKCFDFFYTDNDDKEQETYINGKIINM